MFKSDPWCDGIWRQGLREVICCEGEALRNGISALIGETPESSQPLLVRTQWEDGQLRTKKRALPTRQVCWPLGLEHPATRSVRDECQWFVSSLMCIFCYSSPSRPRHKPICSLQLLALAYAYSSPRIFFPVHLIVTFPNNSFNKYPLSACSALWTSLGTEDKGTVGNKRKYLNLWTHILAEGDRHKAQTSTCVACVRW